VSLRLRLALWYGGLATLVIVLLAGVVYIIHGRSLYDDVDRELANDAAHFAPVFNLVAEARQEEIAARSSRQIHTFVRLYDANGAPLTPTDSGALPPIDVMGAAEKPDDSAYTNVLKWLPGGGVSAPGSFVTVDDAPVANRARVYVLPIMTNGQATGYVQTWASLDGVDRAAKRFSLLLLAMGSIGVALVGAFGYAVSGPAIRPVGAMVRTAESIARSHNFSRRVPAPAAVRGDELGELARTFNEMLEALETSFAAQQRFMADAAHELRAPLTILRGNLELLDRVPDMPDEDRRIALASLHEQAKRVSRLVDELLLLARSDIGGTLREQTVDLHEVVTTAVADLRAMPDGARVSLDTLEPITLTGDSDRLSQVITGLLDNARKYTPAESRIHVSLERRRGEAQIAVADEGPGIQPADLAHVFERFYRGSQARASDPGGAGLGLAIARAIVEQHQGRIEIESDPTAGTTVTIHLPIETPAETAITSAV
jgi:signal transduction histidine kinase